MRELEEALARARRGESEGHAELYRLLAPGLYSYLLTRTRSAVEAEDALGEAFLALVREMPARGDARGVRAWLYRVATNRLVDAARRRARRPEAPLDALPAESPGGDVVAEANDLLERRRVWEAVRALPDEQREVIALRLAGDLTGPEIAELLDKTPGAVKALQHRALANLARALDQGERAEPYPWDRSERLEG